MEMGIYPEQPNTPAEGTTKLSITIPQDVSPEDITGSGTAFFDPFKYQTKETLTPLILRLIKIHHYLYTSYDPDFLNTLIETTRTKARADHEESIDTDAKI